METLIATLFTLLIILAIAYGCFWLVERAGIPNPFNWILKGIVVIVGLVFLLSRLGINTNF